MKAKHDSYPSFKDFVEFVKLVASEACDPVYDIQQSKSQVKGVSYNTVLSQHHQQTGPRLPVATQANHNPQRFSSSNDNCVVTKNIPNSFM